MQEQKEMWGKKGKQHPLLLLKINENRNLPSYKNNPATLPKDRAKGCRAGPTMGLRGGVEGMRSETLLSKAPGARAWLGGQGFHTTGPRLPSCRSGKGIQGQGGPIWSLVGPEIGAKAWK